MRISNAWVRSSMPRARKTNRQIWRNNGSVLEVERVAALPENDQLRGTPILVTDRRGDAWTTTLTDVEATPRSWSPIPAGTAGEPVDGGYL